MAQKQVTVTLGNEINEIVGEFARNLGMKKADVLRMALFDYLKIGKTLAESNRRYKDMAVAEAVNDGKLPRNDNNICRHK